MITVTVACPVCTKTLTYEHHEDEAWGTIGLLDFGIVEITAHDKGAVILPHMQIHHVDGTWDKAFRLHADNMGQRLARLDADKA